MKTLNKNIKEDKHATIKNISPYTIYYFDKVLVIPPKKSVNISEGVLKTLKNNPTFIMHLKEGYISVV